MIFHSIKITCLKYIIILHHKVYFILEYLPVMPISCTTKSPGYDHHLHVSNKHTHLIRSSFLSIFHCMKVYRDNISTLCQSSIPQKTQVSEFIKLCSSHCIEIRVTFVKHFCCARCILKIKQRKTEKQKMRENQSKLQRLSVRNGEVILSKIKRCKFSPSTRYFTIASVIEKEDAFWMEDHLV